MKRLLIVLLLLSSTAHADQKYNIMNGEWETCTSDSTVKQNIMEGTYSYEEADSTLEYNMYNNRWEWCPPEGDE